MTQQHTQRVSEPRDGESLQDHIEGVLRDQILHGQIQPGGRINVRQLEQVFGVSHIPIREAIRRLEAEGLVVNVPKRGATAASVSLRELDDVYDLRTIIEPQVARRAVERATATELAAIDRAYHALERAEQGAPEVEFSKAHWDFHWAVLAPGSTSEIERLVQKLWRVADRYVRLIKAIAVDIAHEQHHELCEACLRHDGAAASEILERHLHLTGDALRARFHQHPDLLGEP